MSDKRVDPTTGEAVTYKELVATYKKQYKKQEIEDQNWPSQCCPALKVLPRDFSCPARMHIITSNVYIETCFVLLASLRQCTHIHAHTHTLYYTSIIICLNICRHNGSMRISIYVYVYAYDCICIFYAYVYAYVYVYLCVILLSLQFSNLFASVLLDPVEDYWESCKPAKSKKSKAAAPAKESKPSKAAKPEPKAKAKAKAAAKDGKKEEKPKPKAKAAPKPETKADDKAGALI